MVIKLKVIKLYVIQSLYLYLFFYFILVVRNLTTTANVIKSKHDVISDVYRLHHYPTTSLSLKTILDRYL